VRCEGTPELPAHAVVLATGGLSVPATGSDGTGLRVARRLGHALHETYPALTPLLADPPVHAGLAGVSLPVTLRGALDRGERVAPGGFLFTHRGYSGPSVLDLSDLAVRAELRAAAGGPGPPRALQPLQVQWTAQGPEEIERLLTAGGSGTAGALVRRLLPQRLADRLLEEAGVDPGTSLAQLRREARNRLLAALTRYELPWTGNEGYRKAEVTGGGVALSEVVAATMESRRSPGLYLCGEVLDAFGPIGGHNFSWAWATGRLAGRGVRAAG
jgi:predicted Rossmann fold flavoprotein